MCNYSDALSCPGSVDCKRNSIAAAATTFAVIHMSDITQL